jgi:molybdopterin molybdotransferase
VVSAAPSPEATTAQPGEASRTSLTIEQIAAQLQGYDPQALSADAVGDFLARLVAPVEQSERVGIFDACGRVLARDLVSPISVPPHDNSAMDGYAFDGVQLAQAPLQLQVVGTAMAGKAWQGAVRPGQCVKIMTGAIMPAGLDTVVPQEFTKTLADGRIEVPAGLLRAGDNRRCKGEDLMQGHPALQAGERFGPAACGLVASLGIGEVDVFRRLRVACFSTGDEILSVGEPPREGAVYDSNRYTVHALLARLGCEVIDLGVIRDEPARLEQAFRDAAARADAIITTGGVSVGEADFTKAMMKKLGDVAFWRIAMRPGRPMAVGRIAAAGQAPGGGAVLFGLPGNPVAVMVTFLAFVRPALLRMMGARATAPVLLQARSAEAMRKKPGRTEYQRGIVARTPAGALEVRTTGNQGSGVLSSMVQANGLIVLHHAQGSVAVGDAVDVMMFDGVI